MTNHATTKKIEEMIKGFFEKTTIPVTTRVEIRSPSQEGDRKIVEVKIQTDEPQVLIGERGKTLIEIQRLLGRIVNKIGEEQFYVNLDINEYKEKKMEYLKNLAKESADDAAFTKKEKALPPMSSYERRIIHMELSNRSDVETESEGEEPYRRVVIKPK